MKRTWAAWAAACVVMAAMASPGRAAERAAPPAVRLAVTSDGRVLDARGADRRINPASVVKMSTTLWALEKLGPDFRFNTGIAVRGSVARGVLHGDLVVVGDGDPDFHVENAFLVAAALNQAGIRRVEGRLLVTRTFWIGWEGGSEGVEPNAVERARQMAYRMRRALDPKRWDPTTRQTWREFAQRRGLPEGSPPEVRVLGGFDGTRDPAGTRPLLLHRSKPLVQVLRRFNCYSNNDIERLGEKLGSASRLARWLEQRLGAPSGSIHLSTLSGLGRNRLTPRQEVAILQLLGKTTRRLGLEPASVLPVAGCDPGTLAVSCPILSGTRYAGSVTAKTGTLNRTDGGVAALAGIAHTAGGEILFCAAVPRAGRRIHRARHDLERWVAGLVDRMGGALPAPCPAPIVLPDQGARVVRWDEPSTSTSAPPVPYGVRRRVRSLLQQKRS